MLSSATDARLGNMWRLLPVLRMLKYRTETLKDIPSDSDQLLK